MTEWWRSMALRSLLPLQGEGAKELRVQRIVWSVLTPCQSGVAEHSDEEVSRGMLCLTSGSLRR